MIVKIEGKIRLYRKTENIMWLESIEFDRLYYSYKIILINSSCSK